MVELPLTFGKTDAALIAQARAHTVPAVQNTPGGLYPLKSASYEVDEYRIMAGWPVAVPDGDIRIDCLVSAEGDVLGNRTEPTALVTGADMRWVADINYFDLTSLRWAPIQGGVSPWETTSDHTPTLITDYEYRVDDEVFTEMTALNFDSNTTDYMWNDLNQVFGGASGYTVIMVLCPNSIYGNELGVPDNALWGPAATTGDWVQFTVKNQAVYLTTAESTVGQQGVSIGGSLSSTAPTYLAMVIGSPQTTLYASSEPGRVIVKGLPTGPDSMALSANFWLGNSAAPNVSTMDMALLELGIYGTMLTKDQVTAEFTLFSEVYGI